MQAACHAERRAGAGCEPSGHCDSASDQEREGAGLGGGAVGVGGTGRFVFLGRMPMRSGRAHAPAGAGAACAAESCLATARVTVQHCWTDQGAGGLARFVAAGASQHGQALCSRPHAARRVDVLLAGMYSSLQRWRALCCDGVAAAPEHIMGMDKKPASHCGRRTTFLQQH